MADMPPGTEGIEIGTRSEQGGEERDFLIG
jgi:hypothetical protein